MLINLWQMTLAQPCVFLGKGLHSGRLVQMTVKPAPVHAGIVFIRTDIPQASPVFAHASQISHTSLSMTIGEGPRSIATIEHLMAALGGLGITNAEVYLNGPEVPILDGSAAEFTRQFIRAGRIEQRNPARVLRLKRPYLIEDGDKYLRLEPYDGQRYHCSIEFKVQSIGSQALSFQAGVDDFLSIADARTFCHLRDVQAMREAGLALGGGLDNAIVVNEAGILNKDGLRYQDEFVRHKLIDLIGDFSLLGGSLLAEISAHKTGHTLHAKALKALVSRPDYFLKEEFSSPEALGNMLSIPSGLTHYA